MSVALQELEDANIKLIKAKVSSAVKDESRSSADRELRLQQLQQRLHTVNEDLQRFLAAAMVSVTVSATFSRVCVQEAEVNAALMEENVSAREEKQVHAGPTGREGNAVNPCQCQRQCVGL